MACRDVNEIHSEVRSMVRFLSSQLFLSELGMEQDDVCGRVVYGKTSVCGTRVSQSLDERRSLDERLGISSALTDSYYKAGTKARQYSQALGAPRHQWCDNGDESKNRTEHRWTMEDDG